MSTETKRKQFTSEITKGTTPGTHDFTITTSHVDRENDTVAVAGWQLDNYRRSPVVLFGHDYHEPPVARATSVRVQGEALVATVEFPAPGVYSRSDELRGLVEAGFLNAVSVGFRPITWVRNQERGGIDFMTQELLEFSLVSVPANPEALLRPVKTLDRQALGKFLGRDLGVADLDVSREDVAAALRETLPALVAAAMQPGGEHVIELDDEDVELSTDVVRAAVRDAVGGLAGDVVARELRLRRGRID